MRQSDTINSVRQAQSASRSACEGLSSAHGAIIVRVSRNLLHASHNGPQVVVGYGHNFALWLKQGQSTS